MKSLHILETQITQVAPPKASGDWQRKEEELQGEKQMQGYKAKDLPQFTHTQEIYCQIIIQSDIPAWHMK